MFENLKNKDGASANAAAQSVVSERSGFNLTDNRVPVAQLIKKGGKQQAGMPAKAKPGSKEKQQSKDQRVYNAVVSYRRDFCNKYGVTVGHISEYLKAGNKLHGHASADSNSNENLATTGDMDNFIGWFKKKYVKAEI